MASFMTAVVPAAVIAVVRWLADPISIAFMRDQAVRQAFRNFMEFRHRYRVVYARRSLGGVLKPTRTAIGHSFKQFVKGIVASRVLFDRRGLLLLDYLRGITNLCCEFGLKCWWAPALLVANDFATWVGPVPKEELAQPTLDGMLGPVFPRWISDTLRIPNEGKTLSEDTHHEWLLVAMSGDEMRRTSG